MDTHVCTTAWLRIIWTTLGLIPSLVGLMLFGGLGIVGSVIGGAPVAVPFIWVILSFLAALFVLLALPGLIAGWGLLTYQPWARILNIILSAFDLLNFPVGTALGVYSIWAMVHPETLELFEPGRLPSRYPAHF
jgi:hypothetical protein